MAKNAKIFHIFYLKTYFWHKIGTFGPFHKGIAYFCLKLSTKYIFILKQIHLAEFYQSLERNVNFQMEHLCDLLLWRVAELVLVVHKMIPKWFEETFYRICQRAWKKFTNHLLFQILLLFGAVKARKEKGDKWHLMVVGFSAKRHEVNTTGKCYTVQRRAIIWKWRKCVNFLAKSLFFLHCTVNLFSQVAFWKHCCSSAFVPHAFKRKVPDWLKILQDFWQSAKI